MFRDSGGRPELARRSRNIAAQDAVVLAVRAGACGGGRRARELISARRDADEEDRPSGNPEVAWRGALSGEEFAGDLGVPEITCGSGSRIRSDWPQARTIFGTGDLCRSPAAFC